MVAKIDIRHGEMIVVTEGIGDMWAVRCLLEIPLRHVAGAEPQPHLASPVCVAADPALAVFSLLTDADTLIWNVQDARQALAIRLTGERYRRLVVEVDDPIDAADRIRLALQDRS